MDVIGAEAVVEVVMVVADGAPIVVCVVGDVGINTVVDTVGGPD